MKLFLLTLAFAALTGGSAWARDYNYLQTGDCAHPNSQACKNDEAAFAEHHGGQTPLQWRESHGYNQWYQGRQGRWDQQDKNWRFRDYKGDQYWKGEKGWAWGRAEHWHHGDHDRD